MAPQAGHSSCSQQTASPTGSSASSCSTVIPASAIPASAGATDIAATAASVLRARRLGTGSLRPTACGEGQPGESADGIRVAGGRTYVAGSTDGRIRVYDLATRQRTGTFETGPGGQVIDLAVTGTGDVSSRRSATRRSTNPPR
jgi:hypothetical protein